ncbi:class I SAM-dependent methyltransferase [Actinomadura litoris]|uniref:Methyltransferase domain-containing protein n=1 Tax=Actinomadura litoris TaxID=2678616 RepID=A0A7K1KVJ6_9ACTN|nr:class I SAM-dependent methyltransferase [Actinomadura litoris]MUN36200.1 methyltransferase domain-containing protein [Actinomadura litoris]
MVISECRICGNGELVPVLDLGVQAITSVFPRTPGDPVPRVPLELVKCGPGGCGLVQLRHTTDAGAMYTTGSYGYRSSIRPFMVDHLRGIVRGVLDRVDLVPGDLVVDIGSNDSTLLRAYPREGIGEGIGLVGIDPTGEQFRPLYPDGIDLIPTYFSREAFAAEFGDRKAKVVTSIAMFYDLPRPMDVMRDIHDILDDDGVWVSEQSYLPSMLADNAYDVVCHEHLEYYALRQFEWMAERVGLTVVDAEITPVYGGSLNLTMAKRGGRHRTASPAVAELRRRESALELEGLRPYETLAATAARQRAALRSFLDDSRAAGRLTVGYGASTKGNVILQYCGLTPDDLPCIGEFNADKSGRFTPGTHIPIVSEEDAHALRPDQLLVLPWTFRDDFLSREQGYLAGGGRLVFPLPEMQIVPGETVAV